MNRGEQRAFLLQSLLAEQPQYAHLGIPGDEAGQAHMLRALFNLRPPLPVSGEFLQVQDAYLQEGIRARGITDWTTLTPVEKGIYLWQGDITTLQCDGIVNAANRQMLGCFCPNHGCIDNAIHTWAGVQLRLACAELMARQGHDEPVGRAKITPAFNLPCRFVLHTVGPLVQTLPTPRDDALLAECYRSCLALAEEQGLTSVAFCCISTGEFRFPNQRAARIALSTVREYLARAQHPMEVIFNVFKDEDYAIYRRLLGAD